MLVSTDVRTRDPPGIGEPGAPMKVWMICASPPSNSTQPIWCASCLVNATSVRAFLAAEFRPVGAEALLSKDLPE